MSPAWMQGHSRKNVQVRISRAQVLNEARKPKVVLWACIKEMQTLNPHVTSIKYSSPVNEALYTESFCVRP